MGIITHLVIKYNSICNICPQQQIPAPYLYLLFMTVFVTSALNNKSLPPISTFCWWQYL